ncbi:MAG TPA: hypothetical protein VK588_11505 [Chitinophagaceae bacterium]|nr:hypothetical protein [Chitinophagaceae bacterium]
MRYNIYEMLINEFYALEYGDKLRVITNSGKLLRSFTLDKYQFSLYKMNEFYVELKRETTELSFDSIVAINYEDLPADYK